nr:AraC family transcriptional regulator [uncultured Brevundimonas sp.]
MTDMLRKQDFRRQTTGATVSAGYARNLFDYAASLGMDPQALAERSGIALADLDDPDARVPMTRYVALMQAAKTQSGATAFALDLGAAQDFREFSVVGLICYSASMMGEALGELNRFGRLVADVDLALAGGRFEITPRDDGLWLMDRRIEPGAFPELTEATWSRFIAETKRHFPDAPFALEVHVPHAAPAHADDYLRVLGVPTTFGSELNGIRIDPSWLSIPLHNPSRYAFGVLSERASQLLAGLETARTVRGRVEALLIPMLHRGDVGMVDIARQLGMSRATLYRRLAEEGVRFDSVVDDLRHRMALHYLHGQKVSVNETAYLVGFSEPSAFSRAFKRWTGSSPRGARGRF